MPQMVANSLLSAAQILLLGLGFWLIYRVGHFFHIAHGAIFTFGAYCLFFFTKQLGIDLSIAIPISLIMSGFIGGLIDAVVHCPLRQKNATSVIHLIASLGLYIAVTNVLALAFSDQTHSLHGQRIVEGMHFFGARITTVQLSTIVSSLLVTVFLAVVIRRTKSGLRYRAVATDLELAIATGVKVNLVIRGAFVIGSAIAGLSGVLIGLDVDIRSTMGLGPLLLAVVAVIVGGLGSIRGLVLGALLVATIHNFAGLYFGQQWRDLSVFALLAFILFFRPRGLVDLLSANGSSK